MESFLTSLEVLSGCRLGSIGCSRFAILLNSLLGKLKSRDLGGIGKAALRCGMLTTNDPLAALIKGKNCRTCRDS